MTETETLWHSLPRVRFTRRDPLFNEATGPFIWFGSVPRGWVGKPLNPRRWNETWRVTSAGKQENGAEAEWNRAYDEALQWRDWQTCEILMDERETADWWLNRVRDDD